jgi:hypothetical protein
MEDPVCDIDIGDKTGPEKNKEINKEPEISLRLKEFEHIAYKISSEQEGGYHRYNSTRDQIGESCFEG